MTMAHSSDGTIKDLNDGSSQALHALLSSISPENSTNTEQGGGKLTSEQVQRISDKLGEILGDDVAADDGTRRNEKGELLNEEGLPIVDISEPVSALDPTFRSDPTGSFDDPDILPLWALSPSEKARRKAERERILDLLEEEERIERDRDAAAARERWKEELEKRKEAAKGEMEALKKARELQKKMGQALIRNVVATREREEKAAAELEQLNGARTAAQAAKSLKPKKSVSFADTQGEEDVDGGTGMAGKGADKILDWGEVAPAKLRTKGRSILKSRAQMDGQPMKMEVVERHAGVPLSGSPNLSIVEGDSDDESVPGSPLAAASSDDGSIHLDEGEQSDSGDIVTSSSPPISDASSDTDVDAGEGEEPPEWNEDDLDFARHQREIALAYYEKRTAIGADAASAMRAHTHEDEWDRPNVPLEATLASAPPKPSESHFKASLAPASSISTLASHSLGQSVLPSSQKNTLGNIVRMGKLQDNKLVGGEEGESEDEGAGEDEEVKEFLNMLRRGEIANAGPGLRPQFSGTSPSAGTVQPIAEPEVEPKAGPSKVSRFKLSIAQATTRAGSSSELTPNSAPETPIAHAARSSPKGVSPQLLTSDPVPVPVPTVTSQIPRRGPPISARKHADGSSLAAIPGQMPSMVIESPSFRPPSTTSRADVRPSQNQNNSFSTIIDSPSFLPPQGGNAAVESPSFGPPSHMRRSPSSRDQPRLNAASAPTSEVPPTSRAAPSAFVMTQEVKERTGSDRVEGVSSQENKRVSRFRAERM